MYREGQHLASVEPGSGVKHFHLDHLGTVRRITDSSGVIVGSHDYYPFGQEATNPAGDGERMKFTGHERDLRDPTKTTDDLDYMHARYYNPHIGRFLRVDPGRDWDSRKPQSWNTYAYVRGNPLKFVDPRGKAIELGTNLTQATEALEQLRRVAGAGGQYLTLQSRQHSFLGLFKWTSYSVGTNNAGALKASGNVGRALAEWIAAKQTLRFHWGANEHTLRGGGAATTFNSSGATIHIDAARVDGARIGGVTQSIASALVHELGHSLFALPPDLEVRSARGAYGTISRTF